MNIVREFGFAGRRLRKSPVFLVTAVGTIALGVGASTAIFSVAHAVLLRPLPYRDPDRLVLALGEMRARHDFDGRVSNENFVDLREGAKAMFDDCASVLTFRFNVPREDGRPEQIHFAQATPNIFRLLGAKIAAGRDFSDADGQPQPARDPAAPQDTAAPRLPTVAILSYEFWQKRFGGSRDVIGKTIFAGGQIRPEVVGVLAPGFELLFRPSADEDPRPDVWIAQRTPYNNANRNTYGWRVIGRLRAGVSIGQAQDAAELVSSEIRRNFPLVYKGGDFHYRLEPMQAYMVEAVRPAILALMGAVIFLLLIACANVANLMLVRSSLRERELALRAALGGGRGRLIGETLAEALLLAIGGTVLGLGLAEAGIRELIAISPASLPRLDSIGLDPVVLGFAFLIGVGAAGVFGILPALRASRPNVMGMLRGSSRTAGLGSAGPRNAVVIVEVALSFVLLIGSGLMFRSFLALQRVDLGFDAHHLLTFQVLDTRPGNKPEQRAANVRGLEQRLRSLPGVEGVAASNLMPLEGGFSTIRWGKEDALADPGKYQAVDWQTVLPGYFETMGIRLLDGRTFTDADNAPDRSLVVVDQILAAKAFPGESAVGKRILTRLRTPQAEWVEIIGVVAHVRTTSLVEPGREQIYFTDGFLSYGSVARWAIRVAGDPAGYAGEVRAAVAHLDPQLALFEVQPMETLVEHAQASTRFSLVLIGVFAVVAALLAGVGLYGVLSTVVRQRTAEIGVRMALGAAPGSVFRLVVVHGMKLSAAGIALGFGAALALTRAMTSMLVGVEASDPVTYAAMIVLFLLIAAVACWIPAWHAAGLDPTVALRTEA